MFDNLRAWWKRLIGEPSRRLHLRAALDRDRSKRSSVRRKGNIDPCGFEASREVPTGFLSPLAKRPGLAKRHPREGR